MFEKLKANLSSHHSAHPLAKQREEFLHVTATTPLQKKSHFTSEVVASAAAYQAWKYFETHEIHGSGSGKPTHAASKVIMSQLAEAQVDKLLDERKIPFTSSAEEKTFVIAAKKQAIADALRTLRESGYYNSNELEAIDKHERAGHHF